MRFLQVTLVFAIMAISIQQIYASKQFAKSYEKFMKNSQYKPKLMAYRNFFLDEIKMAQKALHAGKFSNRFLKFINFCHKDFT